MPPPTRGKQSIYGTVVSVTEQIGASFDVMGRKGREAAVALNDLFAGVDRSRLPDNFQVFAQPAQLFKELDQFYGNFFTQQEKLVRRAGEHIRPVRRPERSGAPYEPPIP